MTDRPTTRRPLRHDAPRRHPGREHHPLASPTSSAIARMLDEYGMPYIEGGWPGSNPKDIEFFKAARTMTLADREAGRVRVDPPPLEPGRGRPEPARARRGRDAGRDDLRQELAAPRHRGPGRDAAGEPRHDRGLASGSSSIAAARRVYDAEHFFDGYKADRDYALVDAARRPRGGRADARPVRHERRDADRRAARGSSTTSAARSRRTRTRAGRDLGHPHPQRRRAGRRQLDGRGRGRHPPRPGDDQRLRRAGRQREHGLDPRQPRPQDAARARAGGRRRPRRT